MRWLGIGWFELLATPAAVVEAAIQMYLDEQAQRRPHPGAAAGESGGEL